jgi:hypothetical protein
MPKRGNTSFVVNLNFLTECDYLISFVYFSKIFSNFNVFLIVGISQALCK